MNNNKNNKLNSKKIAPYGSWQSPITADLIVSDTIGFGMIVLDGLDVYWIETRPQEGGRHVIVKEQADGQIIDVTPPKFYARTRVHEYGGGAYTVANSIVYFSNFADQKLYMQALDKSPKAITTKDNLRFAEYVVDARRKRIIAVCENHDSNNPANKSQAKSGQARTNSEAINSIVSIALDGSGKIDTLVSGNNFYTSPRLSPDGSKLAWLTWNHPNMPWDGTELWLANIDADGSLYDKKLIAGSLNESIFQPEWSSNNDLYFVSDCSNWWNLYRWCGGAVEDIWPMDAEFGRPQWHLGYSFYAFASPEQIICAYNQKGIWHLARIDTKQKKLYPIETEYTDIWWLKVAHGQAYFRGASPSSLPAIVQLDLDTFKFKELRSASSIALDPAVFSYPQAIEFPTQDGLTAHAFFYQPQNPAYVAPASEKPPLLVKSHGGPTGSTSSMLNLETQYWTSRGFAVLDVNYGGSSGYGREYRKRLYGQWGVVDVSDCVNGALYLVKQGFVDEKHLAITGGSAGGYTTLCALTFHDLFAAGASHFGIADLEAMALDTHKFESRMLDALVAPYPEHRDLYLKRSPVHHADQLSCPIIFFHGLEDKVVPPNQAELMVAALRARKLPVAYLTFADEQHGFRKAETMKRVLEAELYFYSVIFGFELSEAIEPVLIENLEQVLV